MTSEFQQRQRRFFEVADAAHFAWQTGHPYIAATERELLAGLPLDTGTLMLEVGCGEGANLVNVLASTDVRPKRVVGIDLFERKMTFAAAHVSAGRFACADALALPFAAGSFDVVLCRDVLHHLEDREKALAELRRVVRPGGCVRILEPNGQSPLMRLLALIRPHERGILRNTVASLHSLVRDQFPDARIDVRQPLPISRLLLHHQLGVPWIASSAGVRRALRAIEAGFGRVVPQRWWAYVVITNEG